MEIAEIKSSLNIITVLQHYNLRVDKNNMLKCPFHQDKQPSLKIYPDTNTFNCFGCSANGDVIEFIQLKEASTGSACSKHEAITKASELLPGSNKPLTKKPTATKVNPQEKIELLEKLFSYFRTAIAASTPAKAYAQERGLDIFKTEIGFNSGQFHHARKSKEVRNAISPSEAEAQRKKLINECLAHGLLSPTFQKTNSGSDTGYKSFGKGSLVFPLKNKSGNITGMYFRNVDDKKETKHLYLKNREGLYPNYPDPLAKKLILTEAIIDTVTLLQTPEIATNYEILTCYGTNGLTQEHKAAIKELAELEEVVIFFDGDESGKTAALKIGNELKQINEGLNIHVVNTPEGEDINSLSLAHSPDIFNHLLKEEIFALPSANVEGLQATPSKLDTINAEQLIYDDTILQITIWGGIEKENLGRLKISIHVKSKADPSKNFRDDINLYSYSSRERLTRQLSSLFEITTTEINHSLEELTTKLEAYRLMERENRLQALKVKPYEIDEGEKQQALDFLRDKELGKKTLGLIGESGLVGEKKNGLLLFFLYLSRLTAEPLHAIIFGKSGSGKTYLQTRVSQCIPDESLRTITSLTENTLYYSEKNFWKHKVLLIEDLEGVYNAFLPLREFMSKQNITKLTTDKDVKGNNVQKMLTVEGPICVSGATTKESIYEDNANRSFLLHVDESSTHLAQVMDYQRKQQAGIVNEKKQQEAQTLLKNAQRLLRKVKVVNPYALELRIPECVFKKLRTNMHYLKLIEMITFYHQYQRKRKTTHAHGEPVEPYIETMPEDIELANYLVKETLLRKSDELNGDLRQFFESLKQQEQGSFFAKDVRKSLRMHPMKLSRFLLQLEQRGLIKRLNSNRKTGFEYEITSREDYQLLQQGINVLDAILEKIKSKQNGELHNAFTSLSQSNL